MAANLAAGPASDRSPDSAAGMGPAPFPPKRPKTSYLEAIATGHPRHAACSVDAIGNTYR